MDLNADTQRTKGRTSLYAYSLFRQILWLNAISLWVKKWLLVLWFFYPAKINRYLHCIYNTSFSCLLLEFELVVVFWNMFLLAFCCFHWIVTERQETQGERRWVTYSKWTSSRTRDLLLVGMSLQCATYLYHTPFLVLMKFENESYVGTDNIIVAMKKQMTVAVCPLKVTVNGLYLFNGFLI